MIEINFDNESEDEEPINDEEMEIESDGNQIEGYANSDIGLEDDE